jgi:hypothetical protein
MRNGRASEAQTVVGGLLWGLETGAQARRGSCGGTAVSVIEPQELRTKLTAMADEVAKHHRSRVLRP